MSKNGLLAALLLLSPLSIATASPYIPQETFPNKFSAYGAWLYFSPTSETTFYYVDTDAKGNVYGTRHANKMDGFFSGYRVGVGYRPSQCTYFTATWSNLTANHNDSVTNFGNGIYQTLGPDSQGAGLCDFALLEKHFHYFALDLIMGQTFSDNCYVSLSLFGGLHYAKLISEDYFQYSTPIGGDGTFLISVGDQISDFWGIGPQFGLNARLPLWENLSLFGNAAGSILVGRPNTSLSYAVTNGSVFNPSPITPFNAINERIWRCVPQVDLQVGFNYDFYLPLTLCNMNRSLALSFEMGYEMITYFDGLCDLQFTDGYKNGHSFDNYRNATMHGLNVGLSIGF